MKIIIKIVNTIIILAGIAAAIFFFRDHFDRIRIQLESKYLPCVRPIAYSLGSVDERFGLSEKDFLSALQEAEKVWEQPVNKNLFEYSAEGDLKINFVYDARQEATEKLQELDIAVSQDQASFDELKLKYDAFLIDYEKGKKVLDAQIAAFEKRSSNYEAEVTSWNEKGGAPKKVYDSLNKEKAVLDAEINKINKLQSSLNAKVDDINALAVVLNDLINQLNIKSEKFNQIGSERGEEFQEGVYQSGPDGREINIYQFEDRAMLVRVLAHELGHALGLEHLENPDAIMYRLNIGENSKITNDDLIDLKNRCGIE